MRGGNRGTVAYPLMQTEPLQTEVHLKSCVQLLGCTSFCNSPFFCVRFRSEIFVFHLKIMYDIPPVNVQGSIKNMFSDFRY